jgi:hypothetical protein
LDRFRLTSNLRALVGRPPAKPAQSNRNRFELEWHLPAEPGLPTYAALFNLEKRPSRFRVR